MSQEHNSGLDIETVTIPLPVYASPVLAKLLDRQKNYSAKPLGVYLKKNRFVSHWGQVSKYGILDWSSAPNIFPKLDINHFWQFQKKTFIEEMVCRFGTSLSSKKLEDNIDYIVIQHKWMGYSFWTTCFLSRLLRALEVKSDLPKKVIISADFIDTPYVSQTLKLFPCELEIIESDVHLWVPNLILPACRPESSVFHPRHMKEIRSYILNKVLNEDEQNIKPFRKTFIHRDNSNSRALKNEAEVLKMAESFGFTIVDLEKFKFEEQVKYLHESEVVVGLHGAGLANALFMHKSATLVECIEAEFAHYANPFTFRNLCASIGIKYAAIATLAKINYAPKYVPLIRAKARKRMELVNSVQYLDIEEFKTGLKAILN
jgi:hypothetical protein